MINCLKCELARAKVKASALSVVGFYPEDIAKMLSKQYGESYYVVYMPDHTKRIERVSKQHPFSPHIIKVFYGN